MTGPREPSDLLVNVHFGAEMHSFSVANPGSRTSCPMRQCPFSEAISAQPLAYAHSSTLNTANRHLSPLLAQLGSSVQRWFVNRKTLPD